MKSRYCRINNVIYNTITSRIMQLVTNITVQGLFRITIRSNRRGIDT